MKLIDFIDTFTKDTIHKVHLVLFIDNELVWSGSAIYYPAEFENFVIESLQIGDYYLEAKIREV